MIKEQWQQRPSNDRRSCAFRIMRRRSSQAVPPSLFAALHSRAQSSLTLPISCTSAAASLARSPQHTSGIAFFEDSNLSRRIRTDMRDERQADPQACHRSITNSKEGLKSSRSAKVDSFFSQCISNNAGK